MAPASTRTKPAMARSSVVLPQPEGPRIAVSRPAANVSDTPRSASTAPYRLLPPSPAPPITAGDRAVTPAAGPRPRVRRAAHPRRRRRGSPRRARWRRRRARRHGRRARSRRPPRRHRCGRPWAGAVYHRLVEPCRSRWCAVACTRDAAPSREASGGHAMDRDVRHLAELLDAQQISRREFMRRTAVITGGTAVGLGVTRKMAHAQGPKLRVWLFKSYGTAGNEILAKQVEAWAAERKGPVEFEWAHFGDREQKLVAAIQAGNPPDIAGMNYQGPMRQRPPPPR